MNRGCRVTDVVRAILYCMEQESIAYMAIHSIPRKNIDHVAQFFAPYTEDRNKRNRKMKVKINENGSISW